jgi:undecaprenyl diphosphate synthase
MNLTEIKGNEIFTPDQLRQVDPSRIPQHIAIIPDGNRRWAKKNFLLPELGHRAGADQLLNIVNAAIELGVKTLTFYIFSTENWSRPQREVNAHLRLLEEYLVAQRQRMIDYGIRFTTIGDLAPFSENILREIDTTVEATAKENKIHVIFALNYGGRDDIIRAFRDIIKDYDSGSLKIEDISEELVSKHLDTKGTPDPDLLIRTSGELRVSNFLLWQISYSEIYVCDVLWPDFTPNHLFNAVQTFQHRERRLGGK